MGTTTAVPLSAPRSVLCAAGGAAPAAWVVLTVTDQLALFEATSNRPATKGEMGISKVIGPGPERLLAALVLRGLDRGCLRPAAALVLALDDEADGP